MWTSWRGWLSTDKHGRGGLQLVSYVLYCKPVTFSGCWWEEWQRGAEVLPAWRPWMSFTYWNLNSRTHRPFTNWVIALLWRCSELWNARKLIDLTGNWQNLTSQNWRQGPRLLDGALISPVVYVGYTNRNGSAHGLGFNQEVEWDDAISRAVLSWRSPSCL